MVSASSKDVVSHFKECGSAGQEKEESQPKIEQPNYSKESRSSRQTVPKTKTDDDVSKQHEDKLYAINAVLDYGDYPKCHYTEGHGYAIDSGVSTIKNTKTVLETQKKLDIPPNVRPPSSKCHELASDSSSPHIPSKDQGDSQKYESSGNIATGNHEPDRSFAGEFVDFNLDNFSVSSIYARKAGIDEIRSIENKTTNGIPTLKDIVQEELKNEFIQPSELDIDTESSSTDSDKYVVDNRAVFLYCAILSLGGFPLGWDVGTTGSMVNHFSFLQTFGRLSLTMIGVLISSFNVGCLVGCATLCQLALNPKSQLRAALLVYAVGSGIELTATVNRLSIWMYIGGRLGCGIACGSLCVIVPIYIHDLSVDGRRKNFNLTLFQTCICACIIIGNLITYSYYRLHIPFVIVNYFKMGYFVLLNGLLCGLPEPPTFLLRSNSHRKLKMTFEKLYKNCDDKLVSTTFDSYMKSDSKSDGFVHEHMPQEPKEFISQNKTTRHKTGQLHVEFVARGVERLASLPEIFHRKHVKKTVVCCCLMGFQQLTGINYFFYFGSKLFKSQLFPILLGSVNLIGALMSGPIIERYNPKLLLIIGSFSMSSLMMTFCIIGNFADTERKEVAYILLILSSLFILCFSLSWGPCSGILNNAISENKPSIIGVSVSANWILNCVITVVSPLMISRLKFNYGFVFCFNLVIMGLFCLVGL